MKYWAALTAVVLAVAAVACSDASERFPTPTAGPTRTVEPGTPSPSPVATGTPTSAVPTATEVPQPTPTRTPFPTGPSQVISRGPVTEPRVALTFDMGGRVEPALAIMNFLVENDVRATIFITGAILDRTSEGPAVLEIVAENPDLFELGNHSYTHPDFRDLDTAQMAAEVADTDAEIAARQPLDPRPWFRPPFGAYNQQVLEVVGGLGYAYTVMWDFDSGDWRPEADGGPTAQQMVDRVLSQSRNGSIVIFHLGGYNTLEALPAIITGLRAEGFELVTLSQLMGLD